MSAYKLHIGCGERRLSGYIHVDIRPEVGPDIVDDVLTLISQADNVADEIYFCHGIEHLTVADTARALVAWRRVLRPGGVLRLATVNFGAVARLYLAGTLLLRLRGLLNGRQDYALNTHVSSWDYETLALAMGDAGFYDILEWFPQDVFAPGYDDYSFARINGQPISLNVEGTAK